MTYEIVRRGHVCDMLPMGLAEGTVIRCVDCNKQWKRVGWFGWKGLR